MEVLKNTRGGHRGRCTTLITKLNSSVLNPNCDKDELEVLLSELERQKGLILQLDSQILPLLDDEGLQSQEISDSSDKMMKIDLAIHKTRKFLKSKSLEDQQATGSCGKGPIKLPHLTLIKFNGDPLTWTQFWDLFRTSVHERRDISPAVKFQYLISLLEGKAASLISGFNYSESEYSEAIDLLKETFGQTH